MPPRLPTQCATIARTLFRPFSTSPAVLAFRSDSSHATASSARRLANIDGGRSSSSSNRDGSGHVPTRRIDITAKMVERGRSRFAVSDRDRSEQLEVLRNNKMSTDYLKQMPRRWEAGDVYSPHDLSPVEMQKWRRRTLRNSDVVDALGIRPLDMYKNFSLIEHFTTPSGMINHSKLTRLRPVNQRKVAKMVRRVQGMGIYPSVHAHPEMLRDQFFPRNK